MLQHTGGRASFFRTRKGAVAEAPGWVIQAVPPGRILYERIIWYPPELAFKSFCSERIYVYLLCRYCAPFHACACSV